MVWGYFDVFMVVIYYGYLDYSRFWDEVVSGFVVHYCVLVLDACGYGDSDWIGSGGVYYFLDYLFDLCAFLDSIGDFFVWLIGYLMGVSVVFYYAGVFFE